MRDADPSLGVRNRAAPGRSATWSEGEVARLFKRAWRDGYYGLAAIIAVAWSTQLQPRRRTRLAGIAARQERRRAVFFTERGKTGTPVGGALSDRALAVWRPTSRSSASSCMAKPTSSATAAARPYTSDTLGDDFRDIRHAEFGDTRAARWPISAAPAPSRPSPATPRRRPLRTPWATPSAPRMRCSPPTSRSIRRRCARVLEARRRGRSQLR